MISKVHLVTITNYSLVFLFLFGQAILGEGNIRHAGNDPEFAAHALGVSAQMKDRGWHISKLRQRQRIDALVAATMAVYGAVLQSEAAANPGFFVI